MVQYLQWPVRAGELLVYDVIYMVQLLQWPVRAGELLVYDVIYMVQLLQWPVRAGERLIANIIMWPVRAGGLQLLADLTFWWSVINLRIGHFSNSSVNLNYENIWRQYIYLLYVEVMKLSNAAFLQCSSHL
jgi:hypothetical protein